MRSSGEVDRAIDLYADTVRRLCMIYLKSYDDTEDIFQNVFIKYLLSSAEFKSPEHEKAWIIRVTINECKDFLKSFFRKRSIPLDEIQELRADAPESSGEVLDAVMSLRRNTRTQFICIITRATQPQKLQSCSAKT